MYCSACGGGLDPNDRRCGWCGAPVAAPPPPQYPPTPAPPDGAPRRRVHWPLIATGVVAAGLAAALVILLLNRSPGAKPAAKSIAATATATSRTPAATVTATKTATPTTDFATIYAKVSSGVVRIETVSCDAAGIGTGFLLSPTLVATVDHVIDGAVVISLVAGSQRTTGTVIGADPQHDLALVRAARPLSGYNFHFATSAPQVGDQVAAIGFPIGGPITFTHGDVSGLNRPITVDGVRRTGMIQTDAAINPGNSGGPLLTTDGTVTGLVDALETDANGIAFAVSAQQAQPQLTAWEATPQAQPPSSCANPLGPSQDTQQVPQPPPGSLTNDQAAGVVAALNTYFDGINTGNYAAAWAVLSPRLQSQSSESSFADGDASSFDFDQNILNAQATSASTVTVDLSFTSIQEPDKGPNGESCDNWTLEYTMILGADGGWLIDGAGPVNGSDHTAC